MERDPKRFKEIGGARKMRSEMPVYDDDLWSAKARQKGRWQEWMKVSGGDDEKAQCRLQSCGNLC